MPKVTPNPFRRNHDSLILGIEKLKSEKIILMNKEILLKSRPEGRPTKDNFEINDIEKPEPKDGEVLLKSKYVSVDPYMRGRMRDEKSYVPPFEINEPIRGGIIAEVIESKNENFKKGDYVNGSNLQWKILQTSNGDDLKKVDGNQAPLSAYLGVLGLTGLTAYVGLKNIGNLKEGETLVVSGGSGAVGSIVGQIGKIKGCKVVGIAGSDDKVETMKKKFGFNGGINYETTDNMKKAIKEACPNGVDVYWDNVGGETLDAALANINKHGRVINCGAISMYNDTEAKKGPRHESTLVKKSVRMQGFIVRDHQDEFEEGIQHIAKWMNEGKIKYSETVVEGFDNIPQAFIDLFDGKNEGKMVVEI